MLIPFKKYNSWIALTSRKRLGLSMKSKSNIFFNFNFFNNRTDPKRLHLFISGSVSCSNSSYDNLLYNL